MSSEDESEISSETSNELFLRFANKRRRRLPFTSSEEDVSFSDASDEAKWLPPFANERPSSDEESENNDKTVNDAIREIEKEGWSNPIGKQPRLMPFAGTSGTVVCSTAIQNCSKAEDFYLLLVTEDMFEMIASHTNMYAAQALAEKQSSRLSLWSPTNKNEIKRFFGLIIWMGLVRLPSIRLYWSKDIIFAQSFPSSVMSRNRFELLLRMLQFTKNEGNATDPFHKIRMIIDMLNRNIKKYYYPGELVSFDESVVHAKRKSHIRLLKLCSVLGYTYSFQVEYKGNTQATRADTVISVCKDLLNRGHTVCTSGRYTSVDLARKLVFSNTHLVGTLQPNYWNIPREIISKKLQFGEFLARENTDGFTMLKCRKKVDILLLSTKHSTETVTVTSKKSSLGSHIEPKAVVDYEKGKSYSHLANQMSASYRPFQGTFKWYKQLIFELLLNISIVNARILFNSVGSNRISMVEFRKQLAFYLTHCREDLANSSVDFKIQERRKLRHEIKRKEGQVRRMRRHCKRCYERNVKEFGRQFAKNHTSKVVTFCEDCDGKPHLCLPCFNTEHLCIPDIK